MCIRDRDNKTNYINYTHASINADLLNYYKGLIELRKKYEAFRRADYNDVKFFNFKSNPFAMGYSVKFKEEDFIVLFNADPKTFLEVDLPDGEWELLVDENTAGVKSIRTLQNKVLLKSSTGMALKKK